MIPVSPAPEPESFDAHVRQPGLAAIEDLAAKHGAQDAIPTADFPPLWRHALDDLMASYERICAYMCLYIPRGVGAPSTDHMVPKSTAWQHMYEWSNYRLACSLMNARKGTATDVLDPFDMESGWFALDTTFFEVRPGADVPDHVATAVHATIRRLGLNDQQCCEARREYALAYWDGHITYDYLSRHAPFVARELRRHIANTQAG